MLEALNILNAKLDQLEKEYSQIPINNFSVFTDFMIKIDPISTQGRVFSGTANDKNFKQDELFLSSLARAPETIFPTKEEILKHFVDVNAFIWRTLALEVKLDKVGQQFVEGKSPSALYFKFQKELLQRYRSTVSAPQSNQPVSVQAPSPVIAQPREDEGVSFIKRTGFFLNKN